MKHKILIIDDEKSFAQVVKLNLEQIGNYEVLVESEAIKGLSAVLEHHPELVLLDVIMPDLEGPDILNLIRCHAEIKDTPVVFLTATVRKEEVQEQQGTIGGHSFIAKPGSVEELVHGIEDAIVRFKIPRYPAVLSSLTPY